MRTAEAKKEDHKFIIDQWEPRVMFIDILNKEYEKTFMAKKVRIDKDSKRKMKEERKQVESLQESESDAVCEEQTAADTVYVPPTKDKRSENIVLSLPRKVFSNPDLCAMSDRAGMSNNNVLGRIIFHMRKRCNKFIFIYYHQMILNAVTLNIKSHIYI